MAGWAEVEPDLVVLDVMLPGFDGLEVGRRIQARRPIPVLMLTARDAETTCWSAGRRRDDYLTKPFSIGAGRRVHALLGASSGPRAGRGGGADRPRRPGDRPGPAPGVPRR